MTQQLPDHLYIDTHEKLLEFCDKIQHQSYLALDTEFLRERTYRPQLCLIQVKANEFLACIDAIAIKDLSPFLALLDNPNIVKVFHAASQDLEIFYMLTKQVPAPLFDTQIAAPLLGYNEQIGYGNLVNEHLNIELSKAHTRADWTRRPLPDQQIHYALDDVIYLEKLYLDMREQLEREGRLAWLAPEFEQLSLPEKYEQPAGDRWLKIRNIQRYKGATLAIIQALAKWREIKARELNRPRNWLLKDDLLCTLAQQAPEDETALSHIRSLDRKTKDQFSTELLAIINEAKLQTPIALPAYKKKQKLNASKQAQIALLGAWAQQKSTELNINAGILAPPKLLEKCVVSGCESALAGWRHPLLFADFSALLEGQAGLVANKQGLSLRTIAD